jgi:hypothetical protein
VRLALVLLCALPAAAQWIDATKFHTTADLAGRWRFHTGDDEAWADPDFDDSAWTLVKVPGALGGQGFSGFGYGWYRVRVRIQAPAEGLALIINRMGSSGITSFARDSWEAFANGCKIGGWGPMGSDGPARPWVEAVKIPPACLAKHANLTLAIRLWRRPPAGNFPAGILGGIVAGPVLLTTPARVRSELRAILDGVIVRDLPRYFVYLFSVLMAVFGLRLFWLQRARREFLWFALFLLAGSSRTLFTISELAWRPGSTPVWVVVSFLSQTAAAVASIELAAALYGIGLPRWARWLEGGFLALCLMAALGGLPEGASVPLQFVIHCLSMLALSVLIAVGVRRGAGDGRAVTVALLLLLIPQSLIFFDPSYNQFVPLLPPIDTRFTLGPMVVAAHYPFLLLFLGVMSVILTRRFATDAVEHERLSGELGAAREVQRLLVAPGSGVDAVYLPAQEVGGDFYQTFERDAGQVVVIGDVSGKGLRAAMLVSVIVGALRQSVSASPAQVLTNLNRVLAGQTGGGFVTCLCACFRTGEPVLLASAGHLSPYRNGEELALPGGLPLGVMAATDYEEIAVEPGDFVFVTDGVVEAASPAGELFGFNRTRALTGRPAREIAEAAKAWGQNDDITVVTVRCEA